VSAIGGPLETYVASVQGVPHTCVAVITNGDSVAGFVSDGQHASSWFATSHLDDGKAKLFSRQGFELGDVTISGDSFSGQTALLSVGQVLRQALQFEGERATGGAGLFEAAEENGQDSFEAGWIVLPDGSECGTVDTYIDQHFETNPAPKLKAAVNIPPFGSQLPHEETSLYFDVNKEAPG
jgi:hypothetical protein